MKLGDHQQARQHGCTMTVCNDGDADLWILTTTIPNGRPRLRVWDGRSWSRDQWQARVYVSRQQAETASVAADQQLSHGSDIHVYPIRVDPA